MNRYPMSFCFDFGGTCIWDKKEGCGIPNDRLSNQLPITSGLILELMELSDIYETSIDWDYPPAPSPWTREQAIDFLNRANAAYDQLVEELGEKYEIVNEAYKNVNLE